MTMYPTGINGKVAVVTGAAQGIGAAVTTALAAQGAVVAAVDINGRQLDSFVGRLAAKGDEVNAYQGDVRSSVEVDELVKRVERELGPIEILVSVAGILRTGLVVDCSDEDWDAVFAVNATGTFYVCRAIARCMSERRSGTIVTVASNAAGVSRMHMGAYAASKGAATLFTKCLGLELAQYGIRCNSVCPGSTDTEMQRSLWTTAEGARAVIAGTPEAFKVGIPLGRLAEASDIANAVLFLASDQASHITMQDLYVDGGATLRA